MAYLKRRGNLWYGCWKMGGRKFEKSTGVKIEPGPRERAAGMTRARLRRLAEETAELLAATAQGRGVLEDAVAALRAAAAAVGVAPAGGGEVEVVRLGAFARGWLAAKQAAPRSLDNARRAMRRLLDGLGEGAEDLPVAGVSRAMAQDWVARELERVAVGTVERELAEISALFNRAVAEGVCDVNPFRGLRMPSWTRADRQERDVFSREDVRKMMDFPEPWPDMVRCCLLLGGQRFGDVANLRWDQVDWDGGVIRLAPAKTQRMMCKPLVGPLRDLLLRRRGVVSEDGLGAEFVFPYARLRWIQAGGSTSKLSCEFRSLLEASGIADVVRGGVGSRRGRESRTLRKKSFHSLRGTAVSFLLEAGVPAELVRHIVGHDSSEIERRHYFKPALEAEGGAIESLARGFGL